MSFYIEFKLINQSHKMIDMMFENTDSINLK